MSADISRRTLFSVAGTIVGVLGAGGLASCYPPPPPPPPPPRGAPPGYGAGSEGPPPGYEQEGPPPNYGSEEQGPPPGYDQGPPPSEYGPQEGYGPQGGYGARGYGKEPKRVAMYQNYPNGRQHCGICEHFRPPGHCEIVRGAISPDGWCRHFHRA